MIKKILNLALLVSFVVTNMVPLTGLAIHKMASVIFLLLCILHSMVYRKKLGWKYIGLIVIISVAFLSGIFGMIFAEIPLIIQFHKAISITGIFFLAVHIFVFHRRLKAVTKKLL